MRITSTKEDLKDAGMINSSIHSFTLSAYWIVQKIDGFWRVTPDYHTFKQMGEAKITQEEQTFSILPLDS